MFHETYEVSINVSYMILIKRGMQLWITKCATETPEIEGRGGRALVRVHTFPVLQGCLPYGATVWLDCSEFFNSLSFHYYCIRNPVEWSSTAPYPNDVLCTRKKLRFTRASRSNSPAYYTHSNGARWYVLHPKLASRLCVELLLEKGGEELCASSGIIVENGIGDTEMAHDREAWFLFGKWNNVPIPLQTVWLLGCELRRSLKGTSISLA